MTLISREDAIEVVCDKCPITFKEKCEWRNNGHCSTKTALEALQAEPVKHGEWVASRVEGSSSWFVECSNCHVIMPPVNYAFCPNCGAKMKGQEE